MIVFQLSVLCVFVTCIGGAYHHTEEYFDTGASGNCSGPFCDDDDDDSLCPPDSKLDPLDQKCVCTPGYCFRPTCHAPSHPVLKKKGTSVPGDCCDVYECVAPKGKNCSEVICPQDVELCPADSYSLPAVRSPGDCCSTPQGCQCLPKTCETVCRPGYHVTIVKPGNGRPGSCCPEYQCLSISEVSTTQNSAFTNDTACYSTDGTVHTTGETWQEGCRKCTCQQTVEVCSIIKCPELTCNNAYFETEDDCCKICPDNTSCLVENTYRKNGSTWSNDSCIICSCDNGLVFCRNKPGCPELEQTEPDGCLSSNNKLYKNGQVWDDDNCTSCTCVSGIKKCQAYRCEPTHCPNPRKELGDCCPRCEEPTVVQMPKSCPSLEHCSLICLNGFVLLDNGCFSCECKQEICNLNCDQFVLGEDGKKLCECLQPQIQCLPLIGCKKNCSLGYKHDALGCEICKCNVCTSMKKCDKLCLHGFAANELGCPICKCLDSPTITTKPFEINETNSCYSSQGTLHEDGETWHDGCRQCYCHGGMEMCSIIRCPKLNCLNPYFESERDCCPTCPDDIAAGRDISSSILCHSEDGLYRTDGETWIIGSCTKCICHQGQILCETRQCQPTPCQKPLIKPGQCCPVCPQRNGMEELSGKSCLSHPHGSIWRDNSCQSCECNNGQAVCYAEQCEKNTCHHPVLLKNHCCALCLGKKAEEPCHVGNITYQSNEKWVEDNCLQCECKHGRRTCGSMACPYYCDNTIHTDNNCCQHCKGGISIYLLILLAVLLLFGFLLFWFLLTRCWKSRKYSYTTLPPKKIDFSSPKSESVVLAKV